MRERDRERNGKGGRRGRVISKARFRVGKLCHRSKVQINQRKHDNLFVNKLVYAQNALQIKARGRGTEREREREEAALQLCTHTQCLAKLFAQLSKLDLISALSAAFVSISLPLSLSASLSHIKIFFHAFE